MPIKSSNQQVILREVMAATLDMVDLLSKKLDASFSSWKIVQNLVKENDFLMNVLANYEKFDKKILMRIIFALLGLDSQQRIQMASLIKKFLLRAVGDRGDKDEVGHPSVISIKYS
jgi:hypothetical protein